MNKFTKALLVLSASALLAGVPTAFAVNYKQDFVDIQSQHSELTQAIEDKQAELDNVNSLIDGYKNTIDDQQAAIQQKDELISSMTDNIYYTVSYYLGEEVISSELVKYGDLLVSLPESNNSYLITGFALEDGTPIDIETFSPSSNTAIYLQTETRYKVSWRVEYPSGTGSNMLSGITRYVTSDEFYFFADEDLKAEKDFANSTFSLLGWKVFNGDDATIYVHGDEFELTDNITFDALTSQSITATFKVDGVLWETQTYTIYNKYAGETKATIDFDSITEPVPSDPSNIFIGWAVEGTDVVISGTEYKTLKHVTFVAVYDTLESPDLPPFDEEF